MSRYHYRELTEELNIEYEEEHPKMIETLNVEQRAVFDLIMNHVEKKVGQVFFLLMDQEEPARHICIRLCLQMCAL